MEVLEFGNQLLKVAFFTTLAIIVLSALAVILRDRRLVLAARRGYYVLLFLLLAVAGCLVHGIFSGQYSNKYIFNYSEVGLPTFFKFSSLWAGLEGSLLFWTVILGLFAAIVAFQHRWGERHATGRRLEPYVYIVMGSVLLFFVWLTWSRGLFDQMSAQKCLELSQRFNIGLDVNGRLLDGHGLNPQLVNYWFVFHPPSLYLGLVGFTVPFTFALASLMAGELGDYWVRIVRRWTMVAWVFLTTGIILGGLWAYRQLGWGGYWAWDPVENASFLPWCIGTAFLHSVMVQERRDMLKVWNVVLVVLTFFLTIWATWMTRSGVVGSVHAFAGGDDVGRPFQYLMIGIAAVGIFLVTWRRQHLRSSNRFESLLSREMAFLVNNLVLVAIAFVVFFLSFFSKLAHDWLASEATVGPPTFNKVMPLFFAPLLLFTALGPGLGWVKTSWAGLRRNFAAPLLFTALFMAALYGFWAVTGRLGTAAEVLNFGLRRFWERLMSGAAAPSHPTALYPTGLFVALSVFVCATVIAELWRGVRGRVRLRKESYVTAILRLVIRNNRRYGGYTVHIGIAVLTLGIIGSSMFQVKKQQVKLFVGDTVEVGGYTVGPVDVRFLHERPGEPYKRSEVVFRVTQPSGENVAHGDTLHSAAGTAMSAGSANLTPAVARERFPGDLVTEMVAERRFYPKQDQPISEVSIHRRLFEDIYIYYPVLDRENEKDYVIADIFVNPLMNLVYLGWFIMAVGGVFALLPIPGSRIGLAD